MSIRFLVVAVFGFLLLPLGLDVASSLPSVLFRALAREADCIFVAEYMPAPARRERDENQRRSHSYAAIGQAGTTCEASRFTVLVRTDEVSADLASGIYLVFVKRRGPGAFSYANEPFGHLRIENGQVDVLPFFELRSEKIPLEELLNKIRIERGAENPAVK